ncbi:DUF3122 domain-containing protein [Pannus brasiliensis CCIBt3594]|uniref:DUF3122 domain-containing protein n=1 Tax=Pannus brasiliensis CCIBt3594 TaxID=1427578 RepID=A0AAW9QD08_9CHRO
MRRFWLFFLVLVSFLLFLAFDIDYIPPALALTRSQREAPGQMLYQSRHSLRDETGSPWQLVLFKRVKEGQITDLSLRLVGFPEGIEFLHPDRLPITTETGEILTAPDEFARNSPAPNVGQYAMADILPRLPASGDLELSLPLEKPRTLTVPAPVLLEWQLFRDYYPIKQTLSL